jgi:hypothetical protein
VRTAVCAPRGDAVIEVPEVLRVTQKSCLQARVDLCIGSQKHSDILGDDLWVVVLPPYSDVARRHLSINRKRVSCLAPLKQCNVEINRIPLGAPRHEAVNVGLLEGVDFQQLRRFGIRSIVISLKAVAQVLRNLRSEVVDTSVYRHKNVLRLVVMKTFFNHCRLGLNLHVEAIQILRRQIVKTLYELEHVSAIKRAVAVGVPFGLDDVHRLRQAIVIERIYSVIPGAVGYGLHGFVRGDAGQLCDCKCRERAG